jgi:DNA repair protein RecO (recombination protein O)
MRGVVTSGIVLGRTNFQEADRILTILTKDQGKIRVIAKGVRKSKSKLAGGVELFSVSHLTFIPPKKEIGTLISSRLDVHFGNIVADIERTTFAYEVLKRANKITEDAVGPEFFELIKNTLYGLNTLETELGLIQLWFSLHLLKITGHTPNTETDSNGLVLEQESLYTFDFESMAFASHKAGMFGAEHIKLIRILLGQNDTTKLAQLGGTEIAMASSLQLTQAMLKQNNLI